ncbi:MAG: N-acetyltransferase [Deltaproteobacteria bacterium]|nr:N-acetyltransferase [Deltaproteobacteria bacterium]
MVRKAVLNDAASIYEIVESFSKKGLMLHRPLNDIHDSIRDFFVCEADGGIIGAAALHISSEDMGEIRSLAVREGHTRKGFGTKLVTACLDEARGLGLKKVFALTYKPGFFQKLNFRIVNKEVLPHKIWGDCIRCIKFPNCDENAVLIELGERPPKPGTGDKKGEN